MKLIIAASGRYFDCEAVNASSVPVLSINSTTLHLDVDRISYVYFDTPWGYRYREFLLGLDVPCYTHQHYKSYSGARIAADLQSEIVDVDTRRTSFSNQYPLLPSGGTSAITSTNLAAQLGYREIYLAGVDCVPGHFFGEHPKELNEPDQVICDAWLINWKKFAKTIPSGVKVFNCDPESRLDCFEKVGLP